MKILFDQIPLDQMSVSMTMNGAVLPMMAFYIVAAEEQGVATKDLSGTIQNDILKEFMVRNTYIYPPGPSMRIDRQHLPVYLGEDAEIQLHRSAVTTCRRPARAPISKLATRWRTASSIYAREFRRAWISIRLRPGCQFLLGHRHEPLHGDRQDARGPHSLGQDHQALQSEEPQIDGPAHALPDLRMEPDGAGPFNNVTRTCVEALAAVLGHTQSLHTNALDEAIALPTDFSARIARNTQIFLQEETGITKVVDPWGGSYYVESLTHELMHNAWHHIQEIEGLGGMAKAIETGIPKMRIEEAAARRQAQIDSAKETIVGVNNSQLE